MGIPHFVRRLKDNGQGISCELGQTGTKEPHSKAIIDGPGLAYHVWHQLKKYNSKPHVLFRHAEYQECVNGVLAFLQNLESCGFEIEAIIFDGALPESKRDTRISRLRNSASDLTGFKIIHETAVKATRSPKVDIQKIFRSPQLNRARGNLPAPPFLVPSVVEALIDSNYSSGIHIVPDEADPYCAALGRQLFSQNNPLGVVIFTDDSDLIVFDSGLRTKITMMSDLDQREAGKEKVLTGITFSPTSIAQKLGCPDLFQLSYLLSRDPHLSVNEARKAVPFQNPTEDYSEFADIYRQHGDYNLDSRLRGLDPRISEIVCQAQAAQATLEQNGSRTDVHVFLPFILDDPSRSSAWNVGSRTRKSAFAALYLTHKNAMGNIYEHKRSGRNVSDTSISASDFEDESTWAVELKDLNLLGQRTADAAKDLHDIEQWRFAVTRYMLAQLSESNLSVPEDSELVTLLSRGELTDWRLVQLSAQYQAAYYSLRMLAQILQFIQQQSPEGITDTNLQSTILEMKECLQGLPTIAAFFDSENNSKAESDNERAKWLPLVKQLTGGLPRGSVKNEATKAKKRKRQDAKGQAAVKSVANAERSSNPFAALADE